MDAEPAYLDVRCPAATTIAGPPVRGPSVICGAVRNDKSHDVMKAVNAGYGVLLTSRADRGYGGDPSTVKRLCTDRFERCRVWLAEHQRLTDAKKRME